jgi:DNA-binding MarR family transcriptional regulator
MKRQPACICVNLRRAARAVSYLYDEALAASGIKITQFSLLRAVERNEPVAITVLAEELELDRTTLARNLGPLERDRLVVLVAGDDQRVTEVRLTAGGRAAIARALPLWEKTQAEIGQLFARGSMEQLRAIAAEASAAAAKLRKASTRQAPVPKRGDRRRLSR